VTATISLRVAGAQIPVGTDIETNVATILRAIDFAAGERADILLTPEGSLSGYTHEFDTTAATQALAEVTTTAARADLGLALGTCFVEDDGRCYNQIRFYARDGTYLGFHSKTLTCGSLTDPPHGEIEHYAVAPLRVYDWPEIPVGGLICNDLWANPGCTPQPDSHLTQQLAGMGARVVFHAVNGGRNGDEWSQVGYQYHETNLRMRARAGKLWIVTADNCLPEKWPCSAPSGVVSPTGDWVCRAERRGEQLFVYSIAD
jgi:predicted amidohydrolase